MALSKITTESLLDGEVTTAKLADDQITLAKMAGGTDGQVITYDASGNPVAVGPGTDGQVLTSTGAGSPPAFEDAGGGAWSVLSSGTFSSASSVAFTGLSKTTHIYVSGVASGSGFARLTTSTNNGSSYDTGSTDYEYAIHRTAQDGTNDLLVSTGDNDVPLGYIATTAFVLEILIIDPQVARRTFFQSTCFAQYQSRETKGYRDSAGDVDAVQLTASSGNWTGNYVVIELN